MSIARRLPARTARRLPARTARRLPAPAHAHMYLYRVVQIHISTRTRSWTQDILRLPTAKKVNFFHIYIYTYICMEIPGHTASRRLARNPGSTACRLPARTFEENPGQTRLRTSVRRRFRSCCACLRMYTCTHAQTTGREEGEKEEKDQRNRN